MRAFQVLAVLAAAAAAEHHGLRKQPCDKDCQIKRAQSTVDDAEEALATNIQAVSATKKMLAYTKSIKGNADIASQEKAVAAETQTTALGHMLGRMWGEMREYQTPLYEEKLTAQSGKLALEHASLQAKLANARAELDAVTAKEAAQEREADGDEEVPPAKLVIKKTESAKEDDDDDDDDEEDDKESSKGATAREAGSEADEDAEAEQEKALVGKPWSNDGLAKGMKATTEQHAQLWKHGLSAGDPGRKGMYPADLSAPIPETPLTPKEIFGKKKVVQAPPEPKPEPEPEPTPAKVSTDPVPAEADDDDDDDDETDAVKRVEAASKDSEEADDDDEGETEKAPTKAAAGEGDIGDGMSETHRQFRKFLSGGFSSGDARKGLYPVDLTK